MAKYSIEFNSKSLYRKVNIKVTIPSLGLKGSMTNPSDYYQNNNKTYPLIIFLCGFGDDNNAWQTNTPIDRYLEENEYAAVYINGENKWYLNYGPLDNYYDFIENEELTNGLHIKLIDLYEGFVCNYENVIVYSYININYFGITRNRD